MPDILFCIAVSDLKEEIASLVWREAEDGVLAELSPDAVPGVACGSFLFLWGWDF
jgi:hypothetical protein